jgi:hypothetical protein
MTDHSDLIERVQKELQRGGLYSSAGVITRDITALLEALSSQSLSLSVARPENDRKDAEIERLKGLVAGIRETPQELPKVDEAWTVERRLEERTEQVAELFNENRRLKGEALLLKGIADGAGSMLLDVQRECIEFRRIVSGFLRCPEIADCAPEDKDPDTDALERCARSVLENGPANLADANTNPPLSDLSSLRKGAEVAFKPLEWSEPARANNGLWIAESIFGTFSVGFDDGWRAGIEDGIQWEWEPENDPRSYEGPFAAQSACQAYLETRIRSALVSGSREDGDG